MGPIKILILEHDPNDLELLLRSLKKSDLNFVTAIVETRESYTEALHSLQPDIILSDFSLPDFDGLSAFKIKCEVCPSTPFIVVSGTIGEENAVELIKNGITDYALKEKMFVVPTKIQRALAESADRELKEKAERELEESRHHLQKIMDSSIDMICTIDYDGIFQDVNAASLQVLGYTPDELKGQSIWPLIYPDDQPSIQSYMENGVNYFESRYIKKGGEIAPLVWSVHWNHEEKVSYCIARDVSSIKKAEQQLAERNQQIENILETITDGFFAVDENWRVQYWNRQAELLLSKKSSDILGKNLWDEYRDAVPLKFHEEYHRAVDEGVKTTFEEYFEPLKIWLSVEAYPTKDGLSVFFRDITEKKRVETLVNLEREVLKVYTNPGSTVEDAVTLLFNGVQKLHSELICSILEENDGRLYFWTFSQLPPAYLETLDGLVIAEGESACGTAACRKEKVVVADLTTDPLFKNYREMAVQAGLGSCTVYPLIDPYQNLLGTFSVYLKTARALTAAEELTVERIRYILENILENYRAEIRLKESEENYRYLFEQSPSLLLVYDPETLQLLNVNQAAVLHYGYSRDEFLNMNLRDIRPPEAVKQMQEIIHSSHAMPVFEAVTDHQKKNGELMRVHVKNSTVTVDKRQVRLAQVTDITEQTRVQRALELTQQRFKVLVQEGSDLISILSPEGKYTYLSPAYSQMFGYSAEEHLGFYPFDLIHPEDRERLLGHFQRVQSERRIKTEPYRYRHKNGEYRWMETIGTNLLHDPSVEGIVINSRDITENIMHLKAIEQQNEQLQEIAWLQSHVVRAPVARILGLIDLLNNYREQEAMRAELLDHIMTSTKELDQVIRNIVQKTEQVNDLKL